MVKTVRYRAQNFRNIDDSGWIPLERVTAFVGRSESGKTALLKALHKFNPATPMPPISLQICCAARRRSPRLRHRLRSPRITS
jgi:recombinational DNA repair ATPase RecF